ncbi:MAG TPA: SRPBCC family protein, partial [Acidimicrobiales bacterium]|nr:SRPBCC family protein [Acidimicrobiales bacterium]
MAEGRAEIEIAKPVDDVWAVVGDFGGIAGWMPGIESCRVDEDDRIIAMMGLEVTERLERRDEDAHEIVYRIVGGA